jgi:predicted Fe-Mo cluster-binding NifX family protein
MKLMITTRGDFVAPRIDLSPEVIIATYYDRKLLEDPHSIIVSDISSEIICELALQENVATVICGGIEEQYYQFLIWKKIKVIDGVVGPLDDVLRLALNDTLQPGAILPGVTTKEVSA